MFFKYFFAKKGARAAYKMFSPTHMFVIALCAMCISYLVRLTRKADKERVLRITRTCAIILWVLEITKIIFNLSTGNAGNPNTYVPLYFCSIPLYCTIMSGWGKGTVKRLGDVFLSVGGIIGGVVYILSPSTTAGSYPAFHFITIQSYVLHCIMVYLGLLYMITEYHKLKMEDVKLYAFVVIFVSAIAHIVNLLIGTNLMFVTRGLPGTPVHILYNFSPTLFPLLTTLIQAFPPFFVIYGISKYIDGKKKK